MPDLDLRDLQVKHANLESRVTVLERDMEQIKDDLKEFRDDTRTALANIQLSLQNVVTGALNSMPPWAAQSMRNQATMLGVLGGVSAGLIAGIIALWVHG